MIVVNTSPLILFGKQGKLDLLKKCFKKICIPTAVYEEIMKQGGNPEAQVVQKAVGEKWLVVEKVKLIPFIRTEKLSKGEKEAISLAYKHTCLLLIDDDSAKTYAGVVSIEAHGSLYVLLLGVLHAHILNREAKTILIA